jgi:hypothetical protein
MRRITFVTTIVSLAPAAARAEDRVELVAIPDLQLVTPLYPLDHYDGSRDQLVAGLSLGAGLTDSERLAGAGALSLAARQSWLAAALRSELTGVAPATLRGHHRGIVDLRSNDPDAIARELVVQGELDHGDALALAPVHLGPGRRISGDVAADGRFGLERGRGDWMWVSTVHVDGGATRWLDSPAVERATRRGGGLAIGTIPLDGEIPRGSIDLLRARVEQVSIQRPVAAAGAASLDTTVRVVDVGFAADELTLHIDRDLLAVIDADLGWCWLEAETARGLLQADAPRIRLGTAVAWSSKPTRTRRHVGVAVARTPTYTPDGQRLVGDWRLELASGLESSSWVIEVRGGISWLKPVAGDPAPLSTRYGAQVELFIKLAQGLEIGAYHADAFEPPVAGDPWGPPRAWWVETGVLARIRH